MHARINATNAAITVLAAPAVLMMLTGAGCAVSRTADQVAGEAINGAIAAPLQALQKTKELTQSESARANLEAEGIANEMTVALVLTEGATAPAGAKLGETFGCNDRIAFVKVPRESDSGDTIKDAVTSLLAIREPSYAQLYDALANARLSVDKVQYRELAVEVWLKGTLNSGGACDDPRIKAQLEATIRRLRPDFRIFLNGSEDKYKCIGDMSGRCSIE